MDYLDGRAWIDRLPPQVTLQAAVLVRLLEAVEADPRIRALELKGSMARGTADQHSDLDTRVFIRDEEYDDGLADLPALARSIGRTIDILFERVGSPFLFVQFADGIQLELRAWRKSESAGRLPGSVVLIDRDGLLEHEDESEPPWQVEVWAGWAWMRLYDLDKYLRRGSLWEALVKLEEARAFLVRHHAAQAGVPDPEFGITSILDVDGSLPPRLEETVAALDANDLRRAGHACAELLAASDPRPFADFVLARLAGPDAVEARQLATIGEVGEALTGRGLDYWLFGGWGVDFHAGRVTRAHGDVDFAVWLTNASAIGELLVAGGWRHAPDPDEDGGTGYERDGVRLELTLLIEGDAGETLIAFRGGPAQWWPQPFVSEVRELRGVQARVVPLDVLGG
jgi:predicted nucleotidyltransferase